MLKEFSVKNFLSFKEEVTFSMEALTDSVSEYPDNVSNINNNELLKVSSIYGPNASGKSNLLQAIKFFKYAVTSSTEITSDFLHKNISNKFINSLKQFDFCQDKNNITSFKIFTVNEKYEFGYELELKKLTTGLVVFSYENMSFRKFDNSEFISVFERIENDIEISDGLKEVLKRSEFNISNQISFLSFVNALYISEEEENPGYLALIADFYLEMTNMFIMESTREVKIELRFLRTVYKDDSYKDFVIKKLNELGIIVKDIEVDDGGENPKLYFVREINGKKYKLDLFDESDGTLSLVYLLPFIDIFLSLGGTFLVDELDAHLHPKLTREIIKSFQSKHNNKAQLIFTSHDITNMDNDLFRRDEIWFVVKDEKYSSEIFSLTDIVNYKGEKVRKDAKFNKQYLEGRYGADPFIKKGINWNGENT